MKVTELFESTEKDILDGQELYLVDKIQVVVIHGPWTSGSTQTLEPHMGDMLLHDIEISGENVLFGFYGVPTGKGRYSATKEDFLKVTETKRERDKKFINSLKESGGGALPSRELLAFLQANGVSEEVRQAITAAMKNSDVDPYAQSYAHSMTDSYEEYQLNGIKTQVLYMLGNMSKWKGDEARDAKKLLKKWASK
jgi:hypothetical protein